MIDYRLLYVRLFHRVTDATRLLQEDDAHSGLQCLIDAQLECENLYCEMEPDE